MANKIMGFLQRKIVLGKRARRSFKPGGSETFLYLNTFNWNKKANVENIGLNKNF